MMPKLPEKKKRPWIPRRKQQKPFMQMPRADNFGEMREFYSSKAWRSLRRYKAQISPLCEECERKGLVEPGREVDHRIAIKDGGQRLDINNLQNLCRSCHARKSSLEGKKRRYKKKYY